MLLLPLSTPCLVASFFSSYIAKNRTPTAKIAWVFRRLFGISATLSPAAMSDAKSKVDELIHDNAVMIFSKTWCPSCKESKRILTAKQAEYEAKGTPFSLGVYELDKECQYLDSKLIFYQYETDVLIMHSLQLMAMRFKIILVGLQKQDRFPEFSLQANAKAETTTLYSRSNWMGPRRMTLKFR